MLYTVSIPIADKRVFLTEDTYRLDVKQFPRSWNDGSFLRSFGQFGFRTKPGREIPFQEKTYARANKGIRIAENQHYLRYKRVKIQLSFVFRRVFFDDYSARIDIGIKDVQQKAGELHPWEMLDQVQAIINCRVYTKRCSVKPEKLVRIGRDLSYEFLYATTTEPGDNWTCVDENWCSAGCPAVVVECECDDLAGGKMGKMSNLTCVPGIPSEWGVQLFHFMRNDGIPVWILVKEEKFQKDMLRALRIFLLKYHQERETLKTVIKLIAEKGQDKDAFRNDTLKTYLDTVTSTFSRKKRDGIEQAHITDVVRSADRYVYGGESQAVLDYLVSHVDLQYLEKRCETVIHNTYNFENANIPGNIIAGGEFHDKVVMESRQTGAGGIDHAELELVLKKLDQLIPPEDIAGKKKLKKYAGKILKEAEKDPPDSNKLKGFLSVLSTLKASAEFAAALAALAKVLGLVTLP